MDQHHDAGAGGFTIDAQIVLGPDEDRPGAVLIARRKS
ncbi:hypothetical protein J3R03_002484 [Actinoplanes couchii]|nr:hypothetical protein [Actinoplanes couchii]